MFGVLVYIKRYFEDMAHFRDVLATEQLASFAVEVQPPEHVREHVSMVLEGDFSQDELRFVVYNDAERGEWLQHGKCYCGCDACKYCEQLLEPRT